MNGLPPGSPSSDMKIMLIEPLCAIRASSALPGNSLKLMVSAVAFSAEQMKSPSFSRSSASTTMITSPRAMASTAEWIVENPGMALL